MSSKKVNLIAKLVRGKQVDEALAILKYVPKAAAQPLAKVIQSAAANAEHNFKQKPEALMVKSIVVTEGMTLKRGMPVSRGRWHPILKRASHVTVEVGAAAPVAAVESKKPAKKAAAKPAAPSAETATKEAQTTAE